jgi:hypothetical protein
VYRGKWHTAAFLFVNLHFSKSNFMLNLAKQCKSKIKISGAELELQGVASFK